MVSWFRITVKDLEKDTEEVVEIEDDYVLVTVGKCHLDSSNIFSNGTHVLTVKNSGGKKRVPN